MKSVEELWQDINQWAQDKGAIQHLQNLKTGATEAQIQSLETQLGIKLPDDLRKSLSLHNGGSYFESYLYLGTEGILSAWELRSSQADEGVFEGWRFEDGKGVLQAQFWDKGWIPFAEDSVGNLICVDMNPGKKGKTGQLVYFEIQDRQGPFASPDKNFQRFLSDFRHKLYEGKLEVNDEGFIDEPVLKPSVVPTKPAPSKIPYKPHGVNLIQLIQTGDINALKAYMEQHQLDYGHTLYDYGLASYAAKEDQFELMRALILQRLVDINFEEAHGKRTALFWSAWGMKAKLENIQFLVENGAYVNAMTAYDGTVLHAAVMWEHPEMIEYLLEKGANPLLTNAEGQTPLEYALYHQKKYGDTKAMRMIIALLEASSS